MDSRAKSSPKQSHTTDISPCALIALPPELLLEILKKFHYIRSSQTYFRTKTQQCTEKERQAENRARQLILHALCLTCHGIQKLATPVLYNSFQGTTNCHGSQVLELFHRTIFESELLPDPSGRLVQHLQCLENRLSDRGNSDLEYGYGDVDKPDKGGMAAHYFSIFAEIVAIATNLRHLSVAIVETTQISFLQPILQSKLTSPDVTHQALLQLRTLSLRPHITSLTAEEKIPFSQIYSAFGPLPALTEFRVLGVTSGPTYVPRPHAFASLQRLELTHCTQKPEEISATLLACNKLLHIVVRWQYIRCTDELTPSFLYPALAHHAATLETLHLDTRALGCSVDIKRQADPLGSFKSFRNMTSLTIWEKTLLGVHDWRTRLDHLNDPPGPYLKAVLPNSLEDLTLLVDIEDFMRLEYGVNKHDFPLVWDVQEDFEKEPRVINVVVRW